MKPIQNITPPTIGVGSKVRVISGHYNITGIGSEGVVTEIYGDEGHEYYQIDFYKLFPRESYRGYDRGSWSIMGIEMPVKDLKLIEE